MNMKTFGTIILAAALFLSATAPLPGAEPVKKKAAEGDKLFAQPQVLHLQIEISTANAALLKTDPKNTCGASSARVPRFTPPSASGSRAVKASSPSTKNRAWP